MTSPTIPPPRFDELDGLRGLLALWVMLSHVCCMTGIISVPLPAVFLPVWQSFVFAQPAVDLFIILSGFAITSLLRAQQPSYGRFISGRFFRIYPVYLVCLLLAVVAEPLAPGIAALCRWPESVYFSWLQPIFLSEQAWWGRHILWHLTLLNGLVPSHLLPRAASTLLAPGWSLTLEWQYYLVAPILAVACQTGGRLVLLFVVILAGSAFGSWIYDFPSAFLFTKLPLFLVGMMSQHLVWRRRDPFQAVSPAQIGWGMMLAVTATILTSDNLLALVGWAAVLAVIINFGEGCGYSGPFAAIRRLLLDARVQTLGHLSFPLYLLHWPVIILLLRLLLYWQPQVRARYAALFLLVIGSPVILLLAAGLHRYIETPGMNFGRRLLRPEPK